jgi:hypothetical protein
MTIIGSKRELRYAGIELVSSTTTADMNGPANHIWDGHTGGWDAIFKCGQPTQQLTGPSPRYCASSGQISAGEAWAAGFSSATRYGSDPLGESSDAEQAAATFYSRTAVWMENLRMPAGMYKLIPSKSPDGWSLGVAKQDGEWNDAKPTQQFLGSVPMKGSASDSTTGKRNLVISTRRSPDSNVRELHFMYGSTDLFVRIRPNQVPQSQEANMSER